MSGILIKAENERWRSMVTRPLVLALRQLAKRGQARRHKVPSLDRIPVHLLRDIGLTPGDRMDLKISGKSRHTIRRVQDKRELQSRNW